MFRNLIAKLDSWLHPHPDSYVSDGPCNFECYDNGGCDNCAEWIEFEDADYGACGHWHHPGDELPEYVKRGMTTESLIEYNARRAEEAGDFTQLSFDDELAHAMELHKRLDAIERGE